MIFLVILHDLFIYFTCRSLVFVFLVPDCMGSFKQQLQGEWLCHSCGMWVCCQIPAELTVINQAEPCLCMWTWIIVCYLNINGSVCGTTVYLGMVPQQLYTLQSSVYVYINMFSCNHVLRWFHSFTEQNLWCLYLQHIFHPSFQMWNM